MNFNGLALDVGDKVMRRDLHTAVGGQQQSGISPSSRFPLVLLFSNPSSGEQHGYFDGWQDDGYFHYSGEGQRGDQVMRRGNKRIRDHREDGRQLHLFLGESKGRPITYAGEFECVDHYMTDALDTDEEQREVLMFRLHGLREAAAPVNPIASVATSELSRPEVSEVADVPTEEHQSERFYLQRTAKLHEAERRESSLVKAFEAHVRASGRRMVRKRIRVAGELKPLFCDLYEASSNLLIEAKGSVTRESVRMAVGQLYDYRRFIKPDPKLAVLLPSKPRPDLIDFAKSAGVMVIYRTDQGFRGLEEVGDL